MTGDWEEIVLALMMTQAEYDAHVVREAVEGLGTAEPTLIAILCTRTAQVCHCLGVSIAEQGPASSVRGSMLVMLEIPHRFRGP